MSKQQLTKFCRIFQWVENKDREFAEAIKDLCMEGALTPFGKSTGVTFLFPDKKFRKEIIDKAYSDDADDAIKLINTLIIPDNLKQSSEFKNRPVGGRHGVLYKVVSTDNGRVTFEGGATIVAAKDFNTLAKRDSIAVWLLESGRLPLTGESYTPPMRNFKLGGGDDQPQKPKYSFSNARMNLAINTEAEYYVCMARDGCTTHNPYLSKMVSLLNFLKVKQPDVLNSLLPFLDYEPVVTFYLLIEPFKTSISDFLIPEDILFGDFSWNNTSSYSDAVNEYKSFFETAPDSNSVMSTDRQSVVAQVDLVRQTLMVPGELRSLPQKVKNNYNILVTQNSISGKSPILPADTLSKLTSDKKLWQDEFRFTIHEALQTLRSEPFSASSFNGLIEDIHTSWPGNDYVKEIYLSNTSDITKNVNSKMELVLLQRFVNSTDFLYVPSNNMNESWGSMNPGDEQLYNRNAVAHSNLLKIQGMVRPSGISPQTLQELEIYVRNNNGQLPQEVTNLLNQ